MSGLERRRAPRLQVLDRVHGQLVSLAIRLTLREMGPGGFSVRSTVPFPVGARHLFRFTTATGIQVLIEGAVAHTRPDTSAGEGSSFITGFSFVHSRLADTGAEIALLLEAMKGLPEFEEQPLGSGA